MWRTFCSGTFLWEGNFSSVKGCVDMVVTSVFCTLRHLSTNGADWTTQTVGSVVHVSVCFTQSFDWMKAVSQFWNFFLICAFRHEESHPSKPCPWPHSSLAVGSLWRKPDTDLCCVPVLSSSQVLLQRRDRHLRSMLAFFLCSLCGSWPSRI